MSVTGVTGVQGGWSECDGCDGCDGCAGWLEPLLARIGEDSSVLAVPGTDRIDSNTFQYHPVFARDQNRGGFDLDLYFMWIPQSARENQRRKSVFEPMRQACKRRRHVVL